MNFYSDSFCVMALVYTESDLYSRCFIVFKGKINENKYKREHAC